MSLSLWVLVTHSGYIGQILIYLPCFLTPTWLLTWESLRIPRCGRPGWKQIPWDGSRLSLGTLGTRGSSFNLPGLSLK